MLFSDKKITEPTITMRKMRLNKVSSTKYLGIHIDNNLKFNTHYNKVCNQLTPAIGSIGKIAYFLPNAVKIKLYYSLIYSRMSYRILAWGKTGALHKKAWSFPSINC